jgi:CRP-like cAMP-binding protein
VMSHCRVSENIVGAASRDRQGAGAGSAAGRESNYGSMRRLVRVCGVRRRVHALEPLFLPGDDTRYWYLLEAGCLRVFAPGRGSVAPLLGPGKFFSFGSGGRHELVCEAVEASTVVCLAWRKVESLARHDPTLAQLLRNAARWELELTFQCAAAAVSRRVERVARPPLRTADRYRRRNGMIAGRERSSAAAQRSSAREGVSGTANGRGPAAIPSVV